MIWEWLFTLQKITFLCIIIYYKSEWKRANDRKRKSNIIIETISNRNFIIISSLLVVIILSFIIKVILHINETKKLLNSKKEWLSDSNIAIETYETDIIVELKHLLM